MVKRLFNLSALELLLGGIIGLYLPDVDHLIYVYLLRPNDVTSQRVRADLASGRFGHALGIICDTHNERGKLVFHTLVFQIILLLLAFLIATSSASYFGRGLVLAALVHLSVDQFLEMRQGRGGQTTQNLVPGQPQYLVQSQPGLSQWYAGIGIALEKKQENLYFWIVVTLVLVIGVIF